MAWWLDTKTISRKSRPPARFHHCQSLPERSGDVSERQMVPAREDSAKLTLARWIDVSCYVQTDFAEGKVDPLNPLIFTLVLFAHIVWAGKRQTQWST